MNHFYLVTWNAQGCVISETEKKQVLIDIVTKHQDAPVIFAIQEAGVDQHLHSCLEGIRYTEYWLEPNDAKNKRCTLGFLAPSDIPLDFSYKEGNWPRYVPCCTLRNLGIKLACIHAIAEQHAAQDNVAEVLKLLNKDNFPFILAGDMNSPPACSTHQSISTSIRLVNCGSSTHQCGDELDYFYVHSAIHTGAAYLYPVTPSDHNPVILEVKTEK